MKKLLYLTICPMMLLLWGCSNASDGDVATDGWTSLFDGESLSGWRGYNGIDIQEAWQAVDGALYFDGKKEGRPQINIITEKQFDDFDFKFDWKIEEGTNSGVMFHVAEGPAKPYLTGPEYQIIDNLGFRNGKGEPVTPPNYTGAHYAVEPAFEDATKPIGEWNTGRILVNGNHVEYWLNGVKTAEYEMHSPEWNEQIANAKFKNWKLYATTGKGHLSLQDHGHRVWFRNLKVKEL